MTVAEQRNYAEMTPAEVRALIRAGGIRRPTAGMCAGYAQANLVVLPPEYVEDFKAYAPKTPPPAPSLRWWKVRP